MTREQESDWYPVDGKFDADSKSKTLKEVNNVKPFYYLNFGNHYSKIDKIVVYWGKRPSAKVQFKYRIMDSDNLNEADDQMICYNYDPATHTSTNATYDEFQCTEKPHVLSNAISINITSTQQFQIKEVQVFANFSDQQTSWSAWTSWSKCEPECKRVHKPTGDEPMGEQKRSRSCLNYRHHENVCTDESEQTRNCSLALCNGEGNVRLTWQGKERSNHGLVEIFHNGEWGTICDDAPNITAVSLVACKQLRFETVLRADIGSSWNQIRPNKMWLDEIDCNGNETRLDMCHHHPWGKNNCNKNEEVVIKCHG